VWLHEMFALGGATNGENGSESSNGTSDQGSQDPESEARERIQGLVEELSPQLPVLGLTGRVEGAASDLRLKGFMSTHKGV
jgi:hypothetical protein